MKVSWENLESWLEIALPKSIEYLPPPMSSKESKICTDSRHIKKGEWFLPLKGDVFDGHEFIKAAMKRGARGFFYESSSKDSENDLSKGIEVANTLTAYQQIAHGYRQLFEIPLIAIGGSNGKTTVKEMVGATGRLCGECLSTEANFNNDIGVPKTLLNIEPRHIAAVLEFGARHTGDLEKLCKIAKPNIRCLLNVGMAHLGIFGSISNLLKEKLQILNTNSKKDILITLQDDSRLLQAAKSSDNKVITFGFDKDADIRIMRVLFENQKFCLEFDIFKEQKLKILRDHFHESYAISMAAAIAISLAAKFDLPAIKKGLESFNGIKGRFHVQKFQHLTIIDDSYNANPQSMNAGLESLKYYKGKRVILFLGDMLELGELETKEHQKLGNAAAALTPAYLVTVGDLSIETSKAAKKAGLNKVSHCFNVEEAIHKYDEIKNEADVLYVKGSNSIDLARLVSYAKTT